MDAEPGLRDRVRDEVRSLLVRSPAYRELPEDTGEQLLADMTKVGELLADKGWLTHPAPAVAGAPADEPRARAVRESVDALRELVKAVDFPEFVAALVQGVFRAIVDASIQQMKAFAELLAEVAKTVDQFAEENISDAAARDHLKHAYPGRPATQVDDEAIAAAKRELARQRQQMLATMVLMGINRIVVT
jgi:hypothetical protein